VGRGLHGDTVASQHLVLQLVPGVEDDDGGRGQPHVGEAVREVAGGEGGCRHGHVAHGPEPFDGAALDGMPFGGDGGHRRAVPQQLRRVLLVLAQEHDPQGGRQRSQGGQHPGRQRVGVDRQPYGRPLVRGPQTSLAVARQHLQLPGEPQHLLSRLGRPDRPAPLQQHDADRSFERLESLADCRRRHVQRGGCSVQAAVVDGGPWRYLKRF
jgi:hypothetical protein